MPEYRVKEQNTATDEDPEIHTSRHSRHGSVSFGHPITTTVIEDTGESYCVNVQWAMMQGIAQVLIGMVVWCICLYCFNKSRFHGAAFSFAYHFFVVEGILSLSYINGWSTPMRRRHRRYVHIVLQLCAMCFILYGVFAMAMVEEMPRWRTLHGFTGLITLVLTAITWLISPFVLRKIHGSSGLHMICGLICFLMSSLCLGSGVSSPVFINWADLTVATILLVFVTFYSVFVAFATYKKWALRF